jgi:hypothetical protein
LIRFLVDRVFHFAGVHGVQENHSKKLKESRPIKTNQDQSAFRNRHSEIGVIWDYPKGAEAPPEKECKMNSYVIGGRPAEDLLAELGVTAEEVLESYGKTLAKKGAESLEDRKICMCGHSFLGHMDGGSCVRGGCNCAAWDAALMPSNVRPFKFKSEGYGQGHALVRGLMSLKEKEGTAEWLIERKCAKCHGTEDLTVYPLSLNLRILHTSGQLNKLLCGSCVDEMVRAA